MSASWIQRRGAGTQEVAAPEPQFVSKADRRRSEDGVGEVRPYCKEASKSFRTYPSETSFFLLVELEVERLVPFSWVTRRYPLPVLGLGKLDWDRGARLGFFVGCSERTETQSSPGSISVFLAASLPSVCAGPVSSWRTFWSIQSRQTVRGLECQVELHLELS